MTKADDLRSISRSCGAVKDYCMGIATQVAAAGMTECGFNFEVGISVGSRTVEPFADPKVRAELERHFRGEGFGAGTNDEAQAFWISWGDAS